MKQNGVIDDALRLYLFPYSLTHHATAWNDISNFRQLSGESLFEAWERYKLSIDRFPPPPLSSSSSNEVERDPKTIKDHVLTESSTRVPPLVVQPSLAPRSSKLPPSSCSRPSEIPPPTSSSYELPKQNPHQPPIPYPSSLAKALDLIPKYAKMLKDLLSDKEKLLALATNIILQGLPSDVYSLVNHHRVAKDLWKVLLLMQVNQQTHLAEFPQIDSSLAVLVFKQGDDPIDAINKIMSFLSTVVSSHFPTTNNQLRNSSNLRQQATIHDGRVTVQPIQGRQSSFVVGTSGTRANISGTCGNNSGPGKVLNEEELEFLADPGDAEGPVHRTNITHNAAYQADDLDAYDSDCDDFSIAKAILMTNLSSYGSDVLSKDTNSSAQNDAMILSMFEQLSNQVTNYNKVNKDNLIAIESLSAKLERYKEREKEAKNIDNEIALEKKVKEMDNIKAQQIRPMLYDGSVIAKETNVISIADSEETLMLEEESRSKMLLTSDPKV
ncbi:hypothetical protein Tco_1505750 [Tanacetum coccineum]